MPVHTHRLWVIWHLRKIDTPHQTGHLSNGLEAIAAATAIAMPASTLVSGWRGDQCVRGVRCRSTARRAGYRATRTVCRCCRGSACLHYGQICRQAACGRTCFPAAGFSMFVEYKYGQDKCQSTLVN
jgi:hypothetical protein